jgi:RNA polymerase sigma-70 factor (ECF subfamily)
MTESHEIADLLDRTAAGDKLAEQELLGIVYAELRQIAARYLRRERPNHTLQATALVHEAYLRLVGAAHGVEWRGRTHFFATSAQVMRRILTDYARQTKAEKRGGAAHKVELDRALLVGHECCDTIDDLHEALQRLAAFAPREARVVEMRFFGGMTEDEVALALGISSRSVKRDWNLAKAWLYGELRK